MSSYNLTFSGNYITVPNEVGGLSYTMPTGTYVDVLWSANPADANNRLSGELSNSIYNYDLIKIYPWHGGTTAFFDLRNLNLLENGNHMFDGDGYYKQMLETTHLPSLTAGNRMFQYCQNLSGDVSAFIQANSARIVEHDGMFRGCEKLDNYYQLKDNPEYSAWFAN